MYRAASPAKGDEPGSLCGPVKALAIVSWDDDVEGCTFDVLAVLSATDGGVMHRVPEARDDAPACFTQSAEPIEGV